MVLAEMGQLTAENLELNVAFYDPEANYNEINPQSQLGERRSALLDKLLDRSGN